MAENKIKIEQYKNELDFLFSNIREKDLKELNIVSDYLKIEPKMLIKYQIETSTNVFSVFVENKLLCCCGYKKYTKGQVCDCWLFTTKYVDENKISFVKAIKHLIKKVVRETNCSLKIVTSIDYKEAVKFNKFLGFKNTNKQFNLNNNFCNLFLLKGDL